MKSYLVKGQCCSSANVEQFFLCLLSILPFSMRCHFVALAPTSCHYCILQHPRSLTLFCLVFFLSFFPFFPFFSFFVFAALVFWIANALQCPCVSPWVVFLAPSRSAPFQQVKKCRLAHCVQSCVWMKRSGTGDCQRCYRSRLCWTGRRAMVG